MKIYNLHIINREFLGLTHYYTKGLHTGNICYADGRLHSLNLSLDTRMKNTESIALQSQCIPGPQKYMAEESYSIQNQQERS